MGNDGVKGNGKGWQIGEIALPGKGKEIGRYWCDEKGMILGTGGEGNVPRWGNVLAQKRDKKRCREEGCVTTSQTYRAINHDKPQV